MQNSIRYHRKRLGLTLEQLAEHAKTSSQQLQRLECGTRRLTTDWMRRLAVILGVPAADLMIIPDEQGVPQGASGEHDGEFINEPDELHLIRFWRGLPTELKMHVLRSVRASYVDTVAAAKPNDLAHKPPAMRGNRSR